MIEEIFEPVEVGAVFRKNLIKPRWFIWKNRKYEVDEVTYIWHDNKGEELIYYFSVASGAALYQLAYYTKKLNWILDKVYLEG